MSVASAAPPPAPVAPAETYQTFADVLRRLGNVPPHRVRLNPPPGTATEQDVAIIFEYEQRRFELVDGVLVEKAMGFLESRVAVILSTLLETYAKRNGLGIVVGSDGMMRLLPGKVRMPDVAFLSWDRFPDRVLPSEPIPDLAPDLAVEVLSKGNTRAEIALKLREYFQSGVRLVWIIDPKKRLARVHTAPNHGTEISEEESLDGGDVLPGFRVSLRELFEELPAR